MQNSTSHPSLETVELPVQGMDCAGCTRTVQQALTKLPGVAAANVLLGAERAVVHLDPSQVDRATLRRAIEGVGYTVPEPVTMAAESVAARA